MDVLLHLAQATSEANSSIRVSVTSMSRGARGVICSLIFKCRCDATSYQFFCVRQKEGVARSSEDTSPVTKGSDAKEPRGRVCSGCEDAMLSGWGIWHIDAYWHMSLQSQTNRNMYFHPVTWLVQSLRRDTKPLVFLRFVFCSKNAAVFCNVYFQTRRKTRPQSDLFIIRPGFGIWQHLLVFAMFLHLQVFFWDMFIMFIYMFIVYIMFNTCLHLFNVAFHYFLSMAPLAKQFAPGHLSPQSEADHNSNVFRISRKFQCKDDAS